MRNSLSLSGFPRAILISIIKKNRPLIYARQYAIKLLSAHIGTRSRCLGPSRLEGAHLRSRRHYRNFRPTVCRGQRLRLGRQAVKRRYASHIYVTGARQPAAAPVAPHSSRVRVSVHRGGGRPDGKAPEVRCPPPKVVLRYAWYDLI